MNNEYNKTYYNLSCVTAVYPISGRRVIDIHWDIDYPSKETAIREYKKALKTLSSNTELEVMIFNGCKGDEHALYIGQLKI